MLSFWRFEFSIRAATSNALFRSTTRIASYDAAILPLPAGTLTQFEMFHKRLKVLGKTLGHTPSLGVFCWLEITDFDRFFGFLFLVLHVCYLSFTGLASRHLAPLFAPDSPRHTVTFRVATAN
jgi:hypothetical protein